MAASMNPIETLIQNHQYRHSRETYKEQHRCKDCGGFVSIENPDETRLRYTCVLCGPQLEYNR